MTVCLINLTTISGAGREGYIKARLQEYCATTTNIEIWKTYNFSDWISFPIYFYNLIINIMIVKKIIIKVIVYNLEFLQFIIWLRIVGNCYQMLGNYCRVVQLPLSHFSPSNFLLTQKNDLIKLLMIREKLDI